MVGAALTLPDFNQVLAKVKDGPLLPFGRLAVRRQPQEGSTRCGSSRWESSPSTSTPAWRRGIYQMDFGRPARTPQTGGEMGWILETNKAMNRAMEGMGGRVVRKFRVYERELSGG